MNRSISQNKIAPMTTVIKIWINTKIIAPSSIQVECHLLISEVVVKARRQSRRALAFAALE
jgi:hypothetical protein